MDGMDIPNVDLDDKDILPVDLVDLDARDML